MMFNNAVCITVAVSFTLISLFLCSTNYWADEPEYYSKLARDLVTLMYTLLGVGFFIAGLTMNLSLKRSFPSFYQSFRCSLWTACIFLTIPLFFRAIINFAQNISDDFKNWYQLSTAGFLFNITFYLILSTYIPIITQMGSLVFGYLRHKQNTQTGVSSQGNTGASPDSILITSGSFLSNKASSNIEKSRFFDPPIENYNRKFKYQGTQGSSQVSQLKGQGNQFTLVQKQRKLSFKSQQAGRHKSSLLSSQLPN